MKHLLLTMLLSLALCSQACITSGGGTTSTTTTTTTGGGTTTTIENSNGEDTIIILPDSVTSTSDPDATLISLPASFKVKIVNLSSDLTVNHVELQYLSNGEWITIRKIYNPGYSITTDNAVSWFGLYPLDGKMGGVGDTFYIRLYITDGLNESLDYDSTSVDGDNPYYFKFKIDSNRRAY